LNTGVPALPTAARNVLRSLASTHPEYFLAAQKGGEFELEKNVRLGPDGVFIADRKAAGLAQVVEQYGRQDIAEIRTAAVESNAAGCAFAGYLGGGIIGGVPGAIVGGAVGRDSGPALAGMMVGWSMGAVHLYRKCRHQPEKVIYHFHELEGRVLMAIPALARRGMDSIVLVNWACLAVTLVATECILNWDAIRTRPRFTPGA